MFLAYFGKNPSVTNQKDCINHLEKVYNNKTNKEYVKNDNKIYEILNEYGNEMEAIAIMDRKYGEYGNDGITQASKMNGVSMVYKLIKKIKNI